MSTIQLPFLNETIEINRETIADFRTDGHIQIRSVLGKEEVNSYREVIRNAAYKYNTEKRRLEERDTYGKAFLQIMNLWEVDEQVRLFTLAKRFGKIAADLLGVKNVRLYHDQALYKEPGGGFTPWHQDQYYWPLDTNNTITMWMPLVDITAEAGMLTFASESHTHGFIENLAISDDSELRLEKYINENGFSITRPKVMLAGDASFHYGWTLHSAPANISRVTREVMTIIFFADGAHVTEPKSDHQENDRQRWLNGIAPGALAASRLNPLIL
ncbi:phytanoyl-CoA dioxygenase family protein [Paradesertivirga mongoliensis]|uniref:Phytanoyl-CoA dioxygenase family protein n=1 Tax=Paradesertivirga mongoliensis TaxID=2100740 RepID=A0ABW4ZRS4_9SPHI|nr:phytanoyl-CoA dioxygenase family protein [Pedobacter mongoliensis]